MKNTSPEDKNIIPEAENAEETVTNEETAEAAETTETNTQEAAPDKNSAEIEKLKKQLVDEKDKYLRVAAEYDNFRKRSVQDRLNAVTNAQTEVITDVLSVIDNFERALQAECGDENYKKGVEMIFNQYTAILDKLGVKEIDALGKPFDPNFHHAVNQVEDENFGENTVCNVFQKGYTLGSKVIRCAMVSVANP